MIVAIHQPNYISWLGYFYKIAKSDILVFLDNVQYTKNSFINRNKIKTPQGWIWLTLPVRIKGRFGQLIREVELNNSVPWGKKHIKTLEANYSRATYFRKHYDSIKNLYDNSQQFLSNFSISFIEYICKELGIKTEFIKASEMSTSGTSTNLLVDICVKLGADVYLSGFGGTKYQEEESFKRAGIKLQYSDFIHPVYPQLWGEFIPNLSILDLLFNCGEKSLDILLGKGDAKEMNRQR
jgi:hypothetical protein